MPVAQEPTTCQAEAHVVAGRQPQMWLLGTVRLQSEASPSSLQGFRDSSTCVTADWPAVVGTLRLSVALHLLVPFTRAPCACTRPVGGLLTLTSMTQRGNYSASLVPIGSLLGPVM